LNGHGRQDLLEPVEPLTSELVTNAYRHTRGPASLRLTALADGRLRVSHPRIPAPFGDPPWDRVPAAPVDAERGRGLHLVQEYADWWGGFRIGDGLLERGAGKLLWFEVGGRPIQDAAGRGTTLLES
jgi:hypothetical protein